MFDEVFIHFAEGFIDLIKKRDGKNAEILAKASEAKGQHRFYHWEPEFPEVFYEKGGKKDNAGFDAAVANPPYISFGLGHVSTIPDEEEAYIRSNFKSAEYKISIYGLFIEHAVRIVCRHGIGGMILPDSFLSGMFLRN